MDDEDDGLDESLWRSAQWRDGAWAGARIGSLFGGLGAFAFFMAAYALAMLTSDGSCR